MIQANIPANKAVFSSFKTKASFLLKERFIPLNGTSDNIRNYDVSLDYIYAFSELILHILSFNYTHFLLLEKIIPSISITKS